MVAVKAGSIEFSEFSPETVWRGIYRGIVFEIRTHDNDKRMLSDMWKKGWTYYIHLELDEIPAEHDPESFWLEPVDTLGRLHESAVKLFEGMKEAGVEPILPVPPKPDHAHWGYVYFDHPVMGEVEFHGGITYYEKEGGYGLMPRSVKIGCDFQHSWDVKKDYDLADIVADMRQAVDSIYTLMPGYGQKGE